MASENRYYNSLRELMDAECYVALKKRTIHKIYKEQHKTLFLILDIMMVLVFLFNIGALAITNAMVVKNEPTKTFMEANPVTAEVHDYQTSKAVNNHFWSFVLTLAAYIIIIVSYLGMRFTVYKYDGLMTMIGMVIAWFILTGFDFFNDFGYLAGKLLYG